MGGEDREGRGRERGRIRKGGLCLLVLSILASGVVGLVVGCLHSSNPCTGVDLHVYKFKMTEVLDSIITVNYRPNSSVFNVSDKFRVVSKERYCVLCYYIINVYFYILCLSVLCIGGVMNKRVHWRIQTPQLGEGATTLPPFSSLSIPPLEVGPLNTARGFGERCNLPAGSGAEPQLKSNLVHFSLKI